MHAMAFVFIAWIVCVMWALVHDDYKAFTETEQGTDDDEYDDPKTWGT